MLASGSGPLGALLMIAPLAAIPVFAIVGLPQFSPMVASATDEEEIVPDHELRPAVSRSGQRKSRAADDLFAPMGTQTPDVFADHQGATRRNRNFESSRSTGESRRHGRDLTPDPAELDESWEVIPDVPAEIQTPRRGPRPDSGTLPESFDDPRGSIPSKEKKRPERLRQPDSETPDGVPADQFNAELMHPGEPLVRQLKSPTLEGPAPSDADPRRQQLPPRQSDPRRRLEDETAQNQSDGMEQSRWLLAGNRLKELGIHKFRLAWNFERQKFLFRCILPANDGSGVSDLFDADADTPLDAVEAVVQQIDEWLEQGRPSGTAVPN